MNMPASLNRVQHVGRGLKLEPNRVGQTLDLRDARPGRSRNRILNPQLGRIVGVLARPESPGCGLGDFVVANQYPAEVCSRGGLPKTHVVRQFGKLIRTETADELGRTRLFDEVRGCRGSRRAPDRGGMSAGSPSRLARGREGAVRRSALVTLGPGADHP